MNSVISNMLIYVYVIKAPVHVEILALLYINFISTRKKYIGITHYISLKD